MARVTVAKAREFGADGRNTDMTEEPTQRPLTAEGSAPPTAERPAPSTVDGFAPPSTEAPERLRHRVRWGLVMLIVLALAVGFLAYQNLEDVTVRAFWWEFRTPLLVVIVATAVLTLVFHTLIRLVVRWRRRRSRHEADRGARNRRRKR